MSERLPAIRIIGHDTIREMEIDTLKIKGVQWAKVELGVDDLAAVTFQVLTDDLTVQES